MLPVLLFHLSCSYLVTGSNTCCMRAKIVFYPRHAMFDCCLVCAMHMIMMSTWLNPAALQL